MEGELEWIAAIADAGSAVRGERIQSLWRGYGEIFRVRLLGGGVPSAIVKRVKPPLAGALDRSDARKRRSYAVETAWYREHATSCDEACRVPRLLGMRIEGDERLLVLEDLDAAGFVERRRHVDSVERARCLAWLAAFHARFLGAPPGNLWPTGTYWHLETRPDELAAIDDPELVEAAPHLDRLLESARYKTFVHGDAKEANFCFGAAGAAAVDFQYVGGGCGMKDVAYLLHGRMRGADDEARALDTYFAALRAALARDSKAIDAGELETEWRALYPVAFADFCRFLAGWAAQHWKRDRESQRKVREILRRLS